MKRIPPVFAALALALVLSGCPSTQPASDVTDTAATLNGSGNTQGVESTYWFQYGKTTAYGSETPRRIADTATRSQTVSERVTGLSPATTYHFRLVGQPSGGRPIYGPDRSFRTLAAAEPQPAFPIRGAFYYPWYPETSWPAPDRIYTRYRPSLGFYDSGSPALVRSHVRALEYAKVEVAISSWWGRGDRTDARLPTLLNETSGAGGPLHWSIYHEPEGYGNPSVEELRSDLTYLRDRYGSHPAYLRINGKFVVFVWAGADGCQMAERWRQANTVGAYVVLKLFHGYRDCPSQPDGWHQYSASPETGHPPHSFTVSPGFWRYDQQAPQSARDLDRFRQNVRNMVASGARFQLLISFNEWGEGTAAESAQEWASPSGFGEYLDALHDDGR